MALEHSDVRALTVPFPLDAHEWRKGRNDRDYVYISESAVVSRLNEVDPSWTLVVTDRNERRYEIERKNTKTGEIYTLVAHELAITVSLTIKGVTRYGIGMADIAPDAAEADKSAVTDALKRAARLFGVGGYLLNDPPGKAQFPAWLAKQGSNPQPAQPKPAPDQPAAGKQPAPHVWTEAEFKKLEWEATQAGITSLGGLLGVSRVSEYAPGPEKALELVRAHAASKAGAK